jgi:hypothetical protein
MRADVSLETFKNFDTKPIKAMTPTAASMYTNGIRDSE